MDRLAPVFLAISIVVGLFAGGSLFAWLAKNASHPSQSNGFQRTVSLRIMPLFFGLLSGWIGGTITGLVMIVSTKLFYPHSLTHESVLFYFFYFFGISPILGGVCGLILGCLYLPFATSPGINVATRYELNRFYSGVDILVCLFVCAVVIAIAWFSDTDPMGLIGIAVISFPASSLVVVLIRIYRQTYKADKTGDKSPPV